MHRSLSLLSISAILVACTLLAANSRARSTQTDASAYCRAVRTADFPEQDKRYSGPKVPDWMYRAMHRTPDNGGYIAWRCESGRVLACWNGGITGPCDKKDTDPHPTQAMLDFCNQQPGASDIGAAVTGHDTIYAWRCSGNLPERGRQFLFPDRHGWQADEWVRVEGPRDHAAAAAPTVDSPDGFVERLFAKYRAKDSPPRGFNDVCSEFCEPALSQLVKHANDKEEAFLDYDPFCQCQDTPQRVPAHSVRLSGAHTAEVAFNDSNRHWSFILHRGAGGWRIADVIENRLGSLAARLRRAEK